MKSCDPVLTELRGLIIIYHSQTNKWYDKTHPEYYENKTSLMCSSEFVPTLGGGRMVRTETDLFLIFYLYPSLTGQMYDAHDELLTST